MAEGAKIWSMSIRRLTASFDPQRAVNSDALVFWSQITTAALGYGVGLCGTAFPVLLGIGAGL